MSNWNQSSFRLTKTPEQMRKEAEEYMNRKRNMVPPSTNLNTVLQPVEMPEFTKEVPSHAPLAPEDDKCHSPKK